MFANVDSKFDLILANPPYVAVEFKTDEKQFATSVRYLPALFAGSFGKRLTKDGFGWSSSSRSGCARRSSGWRPEHGLRLLTVRRTPPKSTGPVPAQPGLHAGGASARPSTCSATSRSLRWPAQKALAAAKPVAAKRCAQAPARVAA